MLPPRGIKDIKGLRALKGVGSLNIGSSQFAEIKKKAELFHLDIEKDSLTKLLEQFGYQKAEREKRPPEITQITNSDTSRPEEQQERENQEESQVPEKDDEQNEKIEKKVELGFRIGKLSFGDLIQGIGSFIDLVSKMEEEGKKEEKREGEFTSPSGRVKAVFGLSVKEGIGGTPKIETFGNVKRAAPRPVVEEEREPLVDIFDEEDHVSVIVELPGVQIKDIHSEFRGDILILSTTNSSYKYYKEVILPKDVETSSAKSKYKNGVFEIIMNKRGV